MGCGVCTKEACPISPFFPFFEFATSNETTNNSPEGSHATLCSIKHQQYSIRCWRSRVVRILVRHEGPACVCRLSCVTDTHLSDALPPKNKKLHPDHPHPPSSTNPSLSVTTSLLLESNLLRGLTATVGDHQINQTERPLSATFGAPR